MAQLDKQIVGRYLFQGDLPAAMEHLRGFPASASIPPEQVRQATLRLLRKSDVEMEEKYRSQKGREYQ